MFWIHVGNEAQLDLRKGDRLVLFSRRAGKQVAEARVASVKAGEKRVEVGLDRPVAGITTGRLVPAKGVNHAETGNPDATECYNASRMCNRFVFRHNVARNSRRIGVLAKGDGGLIEANVFENLGGGGVEFWNAPFEGLAAENYVVSNNHILNCGRIARKHAAIWATLFKSGGDRLHRNILITGNEIVGFNGPALLLCDVADSMVTDNQITTVSNREPITLNNTEGMKLENNHVEKHSSQ